VKTILVSCVVLCLLAAAVPVTAQPEEAYLEFRRWINAQPEEVRGGDVLAAYRAHLAQQGMGSEEIDQRIEWLQQGRERQEVELWNRVLTAEEPRFNTDPNELLKRLSDFRILNYEDTTAAADFGRGETRVVRLLAVKE